MRDHFAFLQHQKTVFSGPTEIKPEDEEYFILSDSKFTLCGSHLTLT